MHFEELHTDRLILRKFTKETFDELYRLTDISEQMRLLGVDSLDLLEAEKKKYDNGLVTYNKRLLYFHLIDKQSKKVIGWCGYHTWYVDHDRAEIGYGLFDDTLKMQGFMTEAMEVILNYGFTTMKLNRIEAFIGADNIASLKTLEKFKFVKEGNLRQHYRAKTHPEDSLVYALLKSDY